MMDTLVMVHKLWTITYGAFSVQQLFLIIIIDFNTEHMMNSRIKNLQNIVNFLTWLGKDFTKFPICEIKNV